jgi:hypothetical protein
MQKRVLPCLEFYVRIVWEETFMLRRMAVIFSLAAAAGFIFCATAFALSDVRGSRDHVLFPRPAGYKIISYKSGNGSSEIPIPGNTLLLSGRQTEILYKTEGRPLSPSALTERFLSALQKAGGEVIFLENPSLGGRRVLGRLPRAGRNVWVMQDSLSLRLFRLLLLDSASGGNLPISREVSPDIRWEEEAQALDLLHIVDRTGRVELPVKFAAGQTVPLTGYESDFRKFVALTKKDPDLNFRVEVWTDPGVAPVVQRTQATQRTAAVIDILTRMGVETGRLTPGGAKDEPTVPVGFVRLTVGAPLPE